MSFKKYNYGRQNITVTDTRAVLKTLNSDFLTQGPAVAEFERVLCNYTGAKYAVAVSSATAGLHIAVLAAGVGKGDEVITSPNTFLASSNAAVYVGAKPVFADIELSTANMTVENIARKINKRTKAVIAVHYAGQSCDMRSIKKLSKKHKLTVIEDAAHAIGSDYEKTKVGCCKYSDMTVFSFHPVKTVTTGEGGAVLTNSKDLYQKLLRLRSHGMTKDAALLTRNDGPWYYEMTDLGFNYRMTDIQASLGVSQMKRLDGFKKSRRASVALYKKYFKGMPVKFLEEKSFSNACFHLCPVLIDFKKLKIGKPAFFVALQCVGLNLQVHYIPVPGQPFYKQFKIPFSDYKNAQIYYEQTVSLPLYYGLTEADIKEIVARFKKVLKEFGA